MTTITIEDSRIIARLENAAATAGTSAEELARHLIDQGLGELSRHANLSPAEMKARLDALAISSVYITHDKQTREYIYE